MVDFTVQIKKTTRKKNIAIKVIEGQIQLLVPKNTSQKVIHELLFKKSNWIRKQISFQQSLPVFKSKQFVSGEQFLYLGSEYKLKIVCGQEKTVKVIKNELTIRLPNTQTDEPKRIEKLMKDWYFDNATKILRTKTETYSKVIGVNPTEIRVKQYKSRWGSCNSKGVISYNWRIIMSPESIVDYLVIHELCHMIHANHSTDYWNLVGMVLPDYKSRRDWLKRNGITLKW